MGSESTVTENQNVSATSCNEHTINSYLEDFTAASEKEISEIFNAFSLKSCDFYPITTWLLKNIIISFLRLLHVLSIFHLGSADFQQSFKTALVTLLFKKPSLDI